MGPKGYTYTAKISPPGPFSGTNVLICYPGWPASNRQSGVVPGPGCTPEHPWEVAGMGPGAPGQKHLQTGLIIWFTVTFQCPAVTPGTL